MLCTYCGRRGHTASRCPTRPRLPLAPIAMAIMLAGCTTTSPVSIPDLARPSADLMAAPRPLQDIPACEADPACRMPYYIASRNVCVATADQLRGLQSYVNVITAKRN